MPQHRNRLMQKTAAVNFMNLNVEAQAVRSEQLRKSSIYTDMEKFKYIREINQLNGASMR